LTTIVVFKIPVYSLLLFQIVMSEARKYTVKILVKYILLKWIF